MRLRYEDLVDNLVAQLADVIEFSELDAALDEVGAASGLVNPGRAAYREGERLAQLAVKSENRLTRYGYSDQTDRGARESEMRRGLSVPRRRSAECPTRQVSNVEVGAERERETVPS